MQTNGSGAGQDRFAREAGTASAVADIAEPVLADLGFRLVRVQVMGREPKTVQIMAERPDGTMTVGDCEKVSRQLSPVFDVHEPVSGAYRLEVSSPGIDRPLVRPSDFEAWKGHIAKLELTEPVGGRKRFRGTLAGFDDGEVRIEVDLPDVGEQELGFPVALIAEARLVLTEELVRDALRRAKRTDKDGSSDGAGEGTDLVPNENLGDGAGDGSELDPSQLQIKDD